MRGSLFFNPSEKGVFIWGGGPIEMGRILQEIRYLNKIKSVCEIKYIKTIHIFRIKIWVRRWIIWSHFSHFPWLWVNRITESNKHFCIWTSFKCIGIQNSLNYYSAHGCGVMNTEISNWKCAIFKSQISQKMQILVHYLKTKMLIRWISWSVHLIIVSFIQKSHGHNHTKAKPFNWKLLSYKTGNSLVNGNFVNFNRNVEKKLLRKAIMLRFE